MMTATSRAARASLAALSMVVFAACAKKDAAPGDSATSDTAAMAPMADTTAAMGAATLNDAQIAHVVVTANTIDSTAGVMAQQKGAHADVKAFAKTMVSDHGGVNAQAVALATRLNVTPEDNDVSRGLVQGATAARDGMTSLTGAGFDRAYIDREVGYHQAVLDALDGTLIPGAQNAELKKLLTDSRPAFVAHLAMAKEIQGKLAP